LFFQLPRLASYNAPEFGCLRFNIEQTTRKIMYGHFGKSVSWELSNHQTTWSIGSMNRKIQMFLLNF